MKRKNLLLILCLFCTIFAYGQTYINADFKAADAYGNICWYKIIDVANRHVQLWPNEKMDPSDIHNGWAGDASTFASTSNKTLPGSVVYNGTTYYVKSIAHLAQSALRFTNADTLVISEGIEHLTDASLMWCGGKVTILPSTLKRMDSGALRENWGTEKFIGFENTQIVRLAPTAFTQCNSLAPSQVWKLPQTLRYLGEESLPIPYWQRELDLPVSLDTINFSFIDESSVYYSGDYANKYNNFLKVIRSPHATPPHVENIKANTSQNSGFTYYQWNEYGLFSAQYVKTEFNPTPPYTSKVTAVTLHTPDSIYIPVDATAAYEDAGGWNMYKGKYFEKLEMSNKNYVSYYLENENFKVPAGCTAYIVKGITYRTNPTDAHQAQLITCTAGEIIPKQTGFILEGATGTAGKNIIYQANVSGTPTDVTNHWMIGTANPAGEEFADSDNYTYYIFGDGDYGLGFYPQGTRQGKSIKLKAHKAGLRVPQSALAPAKAFILDFEAAKNGHTTAIKATLAQENKTQKIYDLQGRRVTHPTRGIYIINGKKVIK